VVEGRVAAAEIGGLLGAHAAPASIQRHPLMRDRREYGECRAILKEKSIVTKLSKAQLNGLLATARGEVVRTYTGSVYTITGPVGSKALWGLMRTGLISDRPRVPRRSKIPMVLTARGRRVLNAPPRL
jgi:hypothetical protein